jgi:uncharacterized protein (DUF4415 family)
MTQKDTIVQYKLSEIKEQVMAGESKSSSNALAGPEEERGFWQRAQVVVPTGETSVDLCVDTDVFLWFQQQGTAPLSHMNAVLRSYMQAHRTS